jgi:flavin reductase (DIM6/NTAB) family NADH-FMN oxidoreductase RutF
MNLPPPPMPSPMPAAQASLEEHFKAGMRRLASGVCIVATAHEGSRHGLTVTAICSLSAVPPSILVCINRGASAHDPIGLSRRLSVNVLNVDQVEVAQRFAGVDGCSGEARFGFGDWIAWPSGTPMLAEAAASLDCRVIESTECSSHTVFVCRVDAVALQGAVQPLVYFDRGYASLLRL